MEDLYQNARKKKNITSFAIFLNQKKIINEEKTKIKDSLMKKIRKPKKFHLKSFKEHTFSSSHPKSKPPSSSTFFIFLF